MTAVYAPGYHAPETMSLGYQGSIYDELIIDNFAGGGGASTGIEWAVGRPVDIAINHDPAALAMHKANHPWTKHFCESVWEIDPRAVTAGRPVGLAWFSPDCTHHSKARGGKPREKKIRGLAWVVLRWAATVRPRVIQAMGSTARGWTARPKSCQSDCTGKLRSASA
jgi:DNA (cytosine-5)-methyltransferase 1